MRGIPGEVRTLPVETLAHFGWEEPAERLATETHQIEQQTDALLEEMGRRGVRRLWVVIRPEGNFPWEPGESTVGDFVAAELIAHAEAARVAGGGGIAATVRDDPRCVARAKRREQRKMSVPSRAATPHHRAPPYISRTIRINSSTSPPCPARSVRRFCSRYNPEKKVPTIPAITRGSRFVFLRAHYSR